MKIAVTSTGATLEHYVGARVNRCAYLLIIDPDTMQYQAVPNPAVALSGAAAGKLFAQTLLQEGVHAIFAGGCPSGTLDALRNAGMPILVGMAGSVRRIVQQFKHLYCYLVAQTMGGN
ncbi:MAG: NifB/NifX family molybdenum-iron cluster-binding protein [Planctomycetota bacterium]